VIDYDLIKPYLTTKMNFHNFGKVLQHHPPGPTRDLLGTWVKAGAVDLPPTWPNKGPCKHPPPPKRPRSPEEEELFRFMVCRLLAAKHIEPITDEEWEQCLPRAMNNHFSL